MRRSNATTDVAVAVNDDDVVVATSHDDVGRRPTRGLTEAPTPGSLPGPQYRDVWDFLREGGLAYCGLYDEGYTSIGAVHNTAKNARLLVPAGAGAEAGGSYLPAHMLADGAEERAGRG